MGLAGFMVGFIGFVGFTGFIDLGLGGGGGSRVEG